MSGLGAIITIIIVVAWIVKGLAAATGNDDAREKRRKGRSLEEWDEMQAQRREQQQALSDMRADSSSPNPAQMTMAERIELARQRAREQAGVPAQQGDSQAEALRQARARAEQQAEQQRRQAAQQQRAQRERAEQQRRAQQERAKQQRRRQAQRAEAEQQAQAQRQRQRRANQQQRRSQPRQQPRAKTGSQRERAVAQAMPQDTAVTKTSRRSGAIGGGTAVGLNSRDALRKAFIMKELLDKPIALRDPQADLPS
ncbi:MAG: hypothetical protein AAGI37_02085 [Planctomycetota bacterium]